MTTRRLPAEEGLWAFVLADMTVFAILFNLFAYYHATEPRVFAAGQSALTPGFGLANTFILLTSSWFMVLALRAARVGERRRVIGRLCAVLACGALFVGSKVAEYVGKLGAGHTPVSDNFYMMYFATTGIHLLHLVVGLIAVAALLGLARGTNWSEQHLRLYEGGAVYWHMVDLLWVILFPLVYLIR